jgi:GNAT superfamily N-acetyltransferase
MTQRLQLRPLLAQDHAAVQALLARQGWSQRSLAGWRWALFDAPQRLAPGLAAGWVLEGAGGIVGFLGNLPQRLWLAGQPLPAATCTALLVDPAWRGQGTALLRAFSTQAGVRLFYSATANPLSAPLYRAFRYQPRSEAGLDRTLRWVADSRAFASHALRQQLQRRGWVGLAKAWPAAPLALHGPAAADPAAAQAPGPSPGPATGQWLRPLLAGVGWPAVPAHRPSQAHASRVLHWQPQAQAGHDPATSAQRSRWQTWWLRMLAAHPGLLADRQQDTVAWRLADPDLADSLAAWLLHDAQGGMLGLALARAVSPAAPAAARAELLDWCLLPQTPPAAQASLLAAVGDWATRRGLPFVEARRFSGLALQQLAGLGGRAIALPQDANWTLVPPGQPLIDPATWSMSCIDSDDWFCSHQHAVARHDTTHPLQFA